VKLFLDTSVLLAAANSATGSSRAIFDLAPTQPSPAPGRRHHRLATAAASIGGA